MLVSMAPFMDEQDLAQFVKGMKIEDYNEAAKKIRAFAPFVSPEFLAQYIKNNQNLEYNIKKLAPFL